MRILLLLLLCLLLCAGSASAATNVVVVETDDQTVADMAAMPFTRAAVGDRGVTFDNSFVSLSECCPSRATFLTGQYAHNHGVLSIMWPYGGFNRLRGNETLAVWLRRAGYATGVVGKYLNGFRYTRVPPGWTEFDGLMGRTTYSFYDYKMNVNGQVRRFGHAAHDYQTDVLTRRSVRFIRRHAHTAPFFLWTTYVAPHVGQPRELDDPISLKSTVAAPRDAFDFFAAPLPRPPSFDEADVSDKPPLIRNRPPFKSWQITALERTYHQRLASLRAVDEGVARIVATLRRAGVLSHTLLVFTSDNGYLTGEHRMLDGKILPYEPSIRVPLLMRGPGIPRGVRRSQLVWNGDLAPTILDATGARAALPLDGRSLLPLARSRRVARDRTILLEGPPAGRTNGLPRFVGVRTPRYKYVEHLWGARELYDLQRDPYELQNLAGIPTMWGVQARLAGELARLRGCAGAQCR